MKKIFILFGLSFTFITLAQEKLDEVKVKGSKKGLQKSLKTTTNTTVVTSKELLKAACCNLAESFETNPAIDVNFSDALTGTKQIKMLGLTSPYILIAEENIPSVRGASQAYGLSFTPGTWVESIQITKGAGSVINGYESISGQINTELIKPLKDIPFFLNFYGSTDSRFELNTHLNKKFSQNWASSLFIHGNTRVTKNDMNHDHFLDNPLGKQINITNRWHYQNTETGWISFFNIKFLKDEKQTGEMNFNPKTDKLTTNFWGSEIKTERLDFTTKTGYNFKNAPYQSIGFQNAFTLHNQQSYFGLRTYNIKQQSFYSNAIFNSIITNTRHKFSTGFNVTYDKYAEEIQQKVFDRTDNSVGSFFEYNYDNSYKLSYTIGIRADYHNRLGMFFTPRFHLKLNLWNNGIIRFSAGRGKRIANIYAENQNLFASSRVINSIDSSGKTYGLNPEIAWNYGISVHQKFKLFHKNADVTLDFYRTDFEDQVVVDVMNSPHEVLFYNLNGISFANSLQIDFNYEPVKQLNLRTAYKYYDISTDYISGRFQRPLQAKHRFFANLEYETHLKANKHQWRFDFTYNWLGKQQLPYTASNPASEQLPSFSPSFSIMNAQITRVFSKLFEVYIGGENIGNYRQDRAVLGAHNPFGTHFDASIVYAPVFGAMYYGGLRFKIN